MKKMFKKIISVCLSTAMVMSVTSVLTSAASSPMTAQTDVAQEQTIVINLDEGGTKVKVDTSDFNVIEYNPYTRDYSTPYSDSADLSGGSDTTPIIKTVFSGNLNQLTLTAKKFDTSNGRKKRINVNVYTHHAWDDADEYTLHPLGNLTFTSLLPTKVIFSGTAVNYMDKVYFEFIEEPDNALTFDYTIDITK